MGLNSKMPWFFSFYKPRGISSSQYLGFLKRKYLSPKVFKKIGHMGTLDPFAEGVLVVATGGAARLNFLTESMWTKTYLATGTLGISTSTGDDTGEILKESLNIQGHPCSSASLKDFNQMFQSFIGDYYQEPPAFSAAKHKGVPLYKMARQGVFIKKPPVKRKIFRLRVVKVKWPSMTYEVEVGHGTYIRTLFEDMAKKMGTYGHLKGLVRTKVGPCPVEKSFRTHGMEGEEINHVLSSQTWENMALAPQEVFDLPKINLESLEAKKILNGGLVGLSQDFAISDNLLWCESDGVILCLGELVEGMIKPKVNFPNAETMLNFC